ncbi:hypothetical protein [Entomobacter blattae]|uniref:Uncharacterized protein n=1 Tax=Entomobacter blattae TaxID=2762277 RepID=A0A7H1NUE2_9PROT|nr:hypothetical protein [Entomobacter blattae]QNT79402.1 hypothetical protein JGUZn3_22010 [Entomobacter blattae]
MNKAFMRDDSISRIKKDTDLIKNELEKQRVILQEILELLKQLVPPKNEENK